MVWQENQLMKIVHDELAQFFDIADEKEFREIQVGCLYTQPFL